MNWSIPYRGGAAIGVIKAGTEIGVPPARYIAIRDASPVGNGPLSDSYLVECVELGAVAPWRRWVWGRVAGLPLSWRGRLARWVLR